MPTIWTVTNVSLGILYASTVSEARARAVFEQEIADDLNKRHLVNLYADGVLFDHAGGLWTRGSLVNA